MLRTVMLRSALIAFACALSVTAHAYAADPKRIDVPPGDLTAALEALARQSGVELVYQTDQVKGLRTQGVTGTFSPEEAVTKLLEGTKLTLKRDTSGAMLIALPRIRSNRETPAPASDSSRTPSAPQALNNPETPDPSTAKKGWFERFRVAQNEQASRSDSSSSSSQDQTTPQNSSESPEKRVDLGEIVVTATKRVLPLIDVPVAVSVITAEDIVARGYKEYADYLNSLPGVYFGDGGPARSLVRIRGLSVSEGGRLPTTVATYFGETPTSVHSSFPNVRLVDIERVEVLRGPQGTLFGANALSGTLRILPAEPNLENYEVDLSTRGFTTSHSDDESYHVEGVVNLPLVPDRFALRLVGYKDDIAGYIDNVFPGQPALDYSIIGDILLGLPPGTLPAGTLVTPAIPAFTREDINSEDTTGGRIAALWQATERLRFELGYATQDVTVESEPHATPGVGEYAQSRGLDVFEQGRLVEDINIGSLTARYDWDAVSLVSASGWTKLEQRTFVDATELAVVFFGAPIPASLRNLSDGDGFTQELRLQSRGSGALQWLFGLFYLDRKQDLLQLAPDYSCPTCLPTFVAPFLGQAPQDFLFRGFLDFGEEQQAVFGEVTYDFSPRWTVGAGARWLEEDLELRTAADGIFAGALFPATDVTKTVSEFNPSFHLRFRPSDDLTLYLQAAKGFRSSVPNFTLPVQCQADAQAIGVQPLTDPDTLWNYELGFKSVFADDRLSFNAAVYHADWSGIQLSAGLPCGFVVVINAGDATGQGVEFEFVAQPSNAWRFNLAASYNQTEFDQVRPETGFINGERLPNTPEKNLSAGVQYDFDLVGDWSGFARADYVYVGDVRLAIGPVRSTQDAYGTGNVRVGFSRDNLALEIYGRNVADKRAAVSTGDPAFGGDQILIRPRELGVELRYSYQ